MVWTKPLWAEGLRSVDSLHADGAQRAILFQLDAELDGAATDLTVFYVLALAGGQVDPGFEAFAAIRALHGHELFELSGLADARFEDRLQTIELIDIALLAAGDALG